MEVHSVTTTDGYVLELHRIPHGRDQNNALESKPVVFLMHGLMSSSAEFVVLGPGNALGKIALYENFQFIPRELMRYCGLLHQNTDALAFYTILTLLLYCVMYCGTWTKILVGILAQIWSLDIVAAVCL